MRLLALLVIASCGGDDESKAEPDDRLSCSTYFALICSRACDDCGCSYGDEDTATVFDDDADCLSFGANVCSEGSGSLGASGDLPASCDEKIEAASCGAVGGALSVDKECNPECGFTLSC